MGKKKKYSVRPLCDNTNQCFPSGEFCLDVEGGGDSGAPFLQQQQPWSSRQQPLQSQLRCDICERVFQYPSQLRDHTLIHTRVRRFVCQVCGMKFMKEHHLKAHQATHSSVRPFPCPVCGRTFTLKANMERHTFVHSTERRFTCTQCGKKFSQPQTLKMHMISHSDVKPFACSICGKGLSRAHNLRAHMAIHRSSKPFKCQLCNSSFTLKGNMQRHLKEKHGVPDPNDTLHHSDRDPPPAGLSGESFILSLDPSEAVGGSSPSRLSEEDLASAHHHPNHNNKRRKNTPKRLKCETPPHNSGDGKVSPAHQDYHAVVPAPPMNPMQNFQQQNGSLPVGGNNFVSQLCGGNNPSDHKPSFTPCSLPIQGTHPGFGFLPRPPGFYADSGMLSVPVPANQFIENSSLESKLQTIHSAIDDLAGKLSSPHDKVMAIHEALDELVHLRPEGNNFRCVKNERMGN